MLQDEDDIFRLSPLSWEQNFNKSSGSITSSPILSSRKSKSSNNSSINSYNYKRNAGRTPTNPLNIRNSLDILKNKFNHKSQLESEENASTNSSNQYFKKSEIYENFKDICQLSIPSNEKILNSSLSSIWPSDKATGNRSSSISISQFDEISKEINSNFLTSNDLYDSDIDMFEDETSKKLYSPSKLLANYSWEYSVDKFKFASDNQSNFSKTNILNKELFNISRDEIVVKIDEILVVLDQLNE